MTALVPAKLVGLGRIAAQQANARPVKRVADASSRIMSSTLRKLTAPSWSDRIFTSAGNNPSSSSARTRSKRNVHPN
jgi:hypothetical protein